MEYFRDINNKDLNLGLFYGFKPIAYAQTPFKDKFGIPRQSGMIQSIEGKIKFLPDPHFKIALKTLESFSHIWVIFVFHAHGGKNWKPSIRPPRLGGKTKVGVLASRSPHRPNPIGISALKIEDIQLDVVDGAIIKVSGMDLLDGTPILDIKPYLPYADVVNKANSGWASEEIEKVPVTFLDDLDPLINQIKTKQINFKEMLQSVLQLDPRPAFHKRNYPIKELNSQGRKYGMAFLDWEIKYCICNSGILVYQILKKGKTDR